MSDASEAQRSQTHAAILAAGQRLFRRQGYRGTSLRDVMSEAGLTIGGFYAHFESKSDLFRACFEKAGEMGLQRVMAGAGKGEFLKPVQRYLSESHIQAKSEGCPLAALISELDQIQADGPLPMVDAYLNRLSKEMVRLGADKERVLALYAMMLGGLALSRTVTDPKLKESLLTQCLRTARTFAARKPQEKK